MTFLRIVYRFLLRLLFPGIARALATAERRSDAYAEKVKNPNVIGADLPGDIYQNWELAGQGDQNEGDRQQSASPTQCPCGVDWAVNSAGQYFNARPNAADIAALYATIQFPNLGSCEGECVAKETFRAQCWTLWRNKTTGQFWLYCSKRVQWHCEAAG